MCSARHFVAFVKFPSVSLYLSSSGSALIYAPKWKHFAVLHIILNINVYAHLWQNFFSLHIAFVFLLICMHLSDKEARAL